MNILKVFTRARKIANVGERAAAKHLRRKKYKILEKNYVAKNNEVDIIAQNRDFLVFIEVKTRSYGEGGTAFESRPAAAVTPKKQDAMIKVAKCYIAYNRPNKRIRFDIIEVYINKDGGIERINHIENAFRQERRNFQ